MDYLDNPERRSADRLSPKHRQIATEFKWNSHDWVLFVGFFDGPGVAGSLAAHGLNSDDHNTGSTIADGVQAADCPAAIVARPPPDPWPAQHPIGAGVNRDASLYFAAPGSGAIAPHV